MTSPTYPSQPLPEHVYAVFGSFPPAHRDPPEELSNRLEHAEWEVRTTAALLEILARAESCDRLQSACLTIANQLQSFLPFQQVMLAICGKNKAYFPVLAVSGSSVIDRDTETGRLVEGAVAEAALGGRVNLYPAAEGGTRVGMLMHRQLLSHAKADWIISSSLSLTSGASVGVWLFLGKGDRSNLQQVVNLVEAWRPHIAACLELLSRAERNQFSRWATKTFAQHRRWRFLTLSAVLGVLLVASFFSVPYRMRAKSRVEPVVRRSICAPFEGILDKSMVEPGEIVAAEQVLARMDGRELRLEILGLDAERKRAEVKRSSAVARHELGAARMAELDIARLELRLRLLKDRIAELEIKSPIRGIVLQGDQKRAEGMPVSLGQKLFEIAPLEVMVFEIAIPERDYAHVAPGQQVVVQLDAYRDRKWRGTLEKLHPRSEKWETDHVFVGEFRAANHDQLLRPGMNGTASINGPRHPWVWNMFHKNWENLVAAFGF